MQILWYALSLVALVVAVGALRGRRSDRPRCAGCGYDRTGADPTALRCPECGRTARSAAEWTARRRSLGLGAMALLAAAALAALPHRTGLIVWAKQTFLPRYRELAHGMAAGVRISIEHDTWNDLGLDTWFGSDRVVATFRDGSRQMLACEPFMIVGPQSRAPGARSTLPADDTPGFGGDIDNDGETDLLLCVPSGGSGGYLTSILYSIGPNSILPKAVFENVWMEDRDGDGRFEAYGFDPIFAYRWTSGAGSTRPILRFRLQHRTLTLDAYAMRAAAPDEASLEALRATIRNASADGGNREPWLAPLLRGTIELLYAGRADAARAFLTEQWRGTADERIAFEREFQETFDGSAYAAAIRALNQGPNPWPSAR